MHPRVRQSKVGDRILHYLEATLGRRVLFKRGGSLSTEAYTYANYASLVIDKRYASNYYTLLGGNLDTWISKKQSIVARSYAGA